MESAKMKDARESEVGYCGDYCRVCHWYTDALRKPATQLFGLVKNHFEVALWINYKGGNSEETLKGLKILSKGGCTFNCKGGGGWKDCPVRKCCIEKGLNFCFECLEFPCDKNWSKKGRHANIFTTDKIRRLRNMKEIGIEEWIEKQWNENQL